MADDEDSATAASARNELVETHTAYSGWMRLLIATIRLSDGRVIRREVEDHGEAVCVLPYNPERRTAVVVQQLRAPTLLAGDQQSTLEAIAGILEDEDVEACVRRESMEEAQLTLDTLEPVFTAWTMPGISTERMHFYLATYSGGARPEVRAGLANEYEDTLAIEVDLAELGRMADSGGLNDLKTLALLQTLRLRRPDLFRS
jgi:nudix-type nucleoside diphosphatase (YffH/AdpP family)